MTHGVLNHLKVCPFYYPLHGSRYIIHLFDDVAFDRFLGHA